MISFPAVILVAFVAVANAVMPCLPPQVEFHGRDTKGRESYDAIDFNKKIFGMKRGTLHMIKDFSDPSRGKRYDIIDGRCDVTIIPQIVDPPRCVPDVAVKVMSKHGEAWEFHDNDGALLHYDVNNPSTIFEKYSPNGKNSVNYYRFETTISQPDVFTIPSSCNNAVVG